MANFFTRHKIILYLEQEMCHNVTNAPKDKLCLELRPEVKVKITLLLLHYPGIPRIPTSNYIEDLLRT